MATTPIDEEFWKRTEPLLPVRKRRFRHPGRKRLDDRRTLVGILFVLRTGIAWQQPPQELGYGGGMTGWVGRRRRVTPRRSLITLSFLDLRSNCQAACDQFDDAVTRRLPFPPGTPTLAPVANLKQMIEELRGGGDRVSIYCFGADMLYDRATGNPQNKYWVWHLLWERGDPLELALQRLHAIKPDPGAGRAPRSGQTGPGFKT